MKRFTIALLLAVGMVYVLAFGLVAGAAFLSVYGLILLVAWLYDRRWQSRCGVPGCRRRVPRENYPDPLLMPYCRRHAPARPEPLPLPPAGFSSRPRVELYEVPEARDPDRGAR